MADPDGSAYRRRVVDDELDVFVEELPAVSLEGPRAVGKTWTVRRRAPNRTQAGRPADTGARGGRSRSPDTRRRADLHRRMAALPARLGSGAPRGRRRAARGTVPAGRLRGAGHAAHPLRGGTDRYPAHAADEPFRAGSVRSDGEPAAPARR